MLPLFCPGQKQSPLGATAYPRILSPSLLLIAEVASGRSVERDFPTTFVVFPSRLSHLTVPAGDLSHSLAFDSLSSCEVDGVLGLRATPAVFRPQQCPLGAYHLPQAPATIAILRYRSRFWSVQSG